MRIILQKEEIKGERVAITGEKARYLLSVLRCNVGDELQILDGEGNFYKSRIADIGNKKVIAGMLERFPCDTESPLNLILVQGILKGEKMDLVIQKATELGVKEIIPVITARSQIRQTRKSARWGKIAEEASRQSGRTKIPMLHEAIECTEVFESYGKPPIPPFSSRLIRPSSGKKVGEGSSEGTVNNPNIRGFIFWEEGGLSLKEAIKMGVSDWGLGVSSFTSSQPLKPNPSLLIAIGPEGGFTEEEIRLAESHGMMPVSLGKRILRAETAAISAVTLIQFLLGDIAG